MEVIDVGLSHDIISEFVRITNDKKEKPKEGIVYGVVAKTSDGNYVKIDGSDLITPAETTTEVQDGERVTVMIKDHTATITGNVTSPSANSNSINKKFESVSDKIGTFELIVADKISANELEVYKATIDVLIAGKATIQDLEVVNATIEHLYAQNATIENLVADKASIKDLDVVNATIENLKAKDAEIEHAVIDNLEATLADIKVLNADFAQIRTLVNGNLTSDNILSFNITSDKVTMEDAFIKDAMIDNISAAKINAGKINTNNVTIGSEDGGMLITGSTQQFVDKDGNVRIQIGRDAKGDFTFILYGEDGVGQLINQNGITASAISDGLIVNDMVSDKAAISGEKLDISSVITEINNDNSTTIKSNKIYLNEQEQSLEVAFNSLKTQVETIKDITISGDLTAVIDRVQANTTEIEVNKERINALILEDSIIKKQVTDLEGDVVETSTTLASKYSELDQTIEGFKTSVADTYATKSIVNDINNNLSTNYSTTSAMNSAIDQKVDEINLSISKTYATNETVSDINDNLLKNYSTTSVMNSTINQKVDEIGLSISETYATISNVNDINDKLLTEYPTITQMDSAITLKTGEIASTVAKKEIQDSGITSTNLFRGTRDYQPDTIWKYLHTATILDDMFKGSKITNVTQDWYGVKYNLKSLVDDGSLMLGETYTMSVWAKTNGANCQGGIYSPFGYKNGYNITSEWQRFEYTFEFTQTAYDSITDYETIRFEPYNISDTGINVYVACWKLEKGTIATDYQPSTQDLVTTNEMSTAIIQKADEISLSVSKNIQIGGTNMLSGTRTLTGAALSGQIVETYKGCSVVFDSNNNSGMYKDILSYGQTIELEPSTEYTLSFWAKGGGYITSYLYPDAVEYGYHHNFEGRTVSKSDGEINTDLEEGTWKRYAITWKTKPYINENKALIVARMHGNIPNGWCYVAGPKFEKGNKPTDWDDNPFEKPTMSEMNSAITQKGNEISLTVSENIKSIQTGGKNIIQNGNFENDTNYWFYERFSGIDTASLGIWEGGDWCLANKKQIGLQVYSVDDSNRTGEWTFRQGFRTTVGQTYTISYLISGHRSHKHVAVRRGDNWGYLGSKYYGEIYGGTNINGWTYDSITFVAETPETGIWFFIDEVYTGSNGLLWVTDVCCVEGSVAQKFTPSFDDYSTTTEMNSAITQKANEITSTVNSNYNTLNNKFNNYPTTTQMNSAITQKANEITSTVNSNYTTLNNKFNNYSTTTQMNSAITQKANEITSTVNMTGLVGTELLPQGLRGNSKSGYRVRSGAVLNVGEYGLYVTSGRSWVETDYIAIDPNLPAEFYYYIQNTNGYSPLTYLGFEQYNWNKQEIGENAATVYVVQMKFTGYRYETVTLDVGTFNPNTRFIKLRWLVNWDDSAMAHSYIHQLSLKQLKNVNGSTQIAQMADKIETKVDVNGVKSTIQQNPESVRIGFNSISDYFDLTSARLRVGHTDGSYTEIGQNGVMYYANGSGNRYHCLMKQGWLGQISGTSWSRTITLPSEFKGKTFSVIVSVTEVNAVNTHDVIKHFKVTVPHNTVNYTNGTFVINMSALAYYVPGQQSATAIQTDVSWIAIC